MTTKPSILIVDDERLARERLDQALEAIQSLYPHDVAGVCDNANDAWTLIQKEHPDIVLLDIHMPGMTGLELAEQLRLLPRQPKVIFLTAFSQHALHAFDVDAVDYLVKPVKEDRLLQALEKAFNGHQKEEVGHLHIPAHFNGTKCMVHVHDIIAAQADWKYVKLLTDDKEYLTEITLQRLLDQNPELFCRIHRSTVVNAMYVQTMQREPSEDAEGKWTIVMRGLEEKFPVSRRMVTEVKDRLCKK